MAGTLSSPGPCRPGQTSQNECVHHRVSEEIHQSPQSRTETTCAHAFIVFSQLSGAILWFDKPFHTSCTHSVGLACTAFAHQLCLAKEIAGFQPPSRITSS